MKTTQCSIALVAFRHKIFAARIPVRIATKDRNLRANVMRRMQPAFTQNMRGHGRGCRFAMHARDEDASLAMYYGSERFRAAQRRFSRVTSASQDRVVDLDR